MKTKRYCLALDLIDDPALIDAYIKHHEDVWPEILESIKDSGIEQLEIYNIRKSSIYDYGSEFFFL